MDNNGKVKWPDFSIDRKAWELAKTALGADAPVSALAQRAQEIKQSLLAK
jgi:hypothetical protein